MMEVENQPSTNDAVSTTMSSVKHMVQEESGRDGKEVDMAAADENENETATAGSGGVVGASTTAKRLKTEEGPSGSPPSPQREDDSAGENDNKSRATEGRTSHKSQQSNRLDAPSKELQCIQKQVLIEKMMSTTSRSTICREAKEGSMEIEESEADETNIGAGDAHQKGLKKRISPKSRDGPPRQPRATFKIESSVLARVKSFLPEMKFANDALCRLPDASKISLYSNSGDELDGLSLGLGDGSPEPKPGTSQTAKNKNVKSSKDKSKPLVEMSIALMEHSDSDTSSDGEDFAVMKTKQEGKGKTDSGPKKGLITELN